MSKLAASSPFKPHVVMAMAMFFFIVYSVLQESWKSRVVLLIPITVLFVAFFAAYAWEMRDLTSMAIGTYKKKEEAQENKASRP